MNRLVRGLLLLALAFVAFWALLYVVLAATPAIAIVATFILIAAIVGIVKVLRTPVGPATDPR